jgi:hypothetical protein
LLLIFVNLFQEILPDPDSSSSSAAAAAVSRCCLITLWWDSFSILLTKEVWMSASRQR